MKKNVLIKILFLIILVSSIGLTGCSIGGSSSSDSSTTNPYHDPEIDFDNDSSATISKNSGTFFRPDNSSVALSVLRNAFTVSNTKNISIELPSGLSSDAIYSVIVHNSSSKSQSIKMFYETIGQNASLRNIEDFNFHEIPEKQCNKNMRYTKWGNLEAKAELKKNLRKQTFSSSDQSKVRAALRTNNHNDEVIGQQYTIKIVADHLGLTYNDYTFTLRRQIASEHAKYFVDNDCVGNYSITDEDIEHFAYEYENYIYPLLIQQYGPFLDIDEDNKLSIVFSKQYARLGFAGLFNSADMMPSESGGNGNERDMIGVWAPGYSSSYTGEYWRASTRETIAHEMQHAINFSAKLIQRGLTSKEAIKNNTSSLGNGDALMEEEWIDEGLSTCTEARYRQIRGQAGLTTINNYDGSTIETDNAANDNRFGSWLANNNISLLNWQANYANYGQKGLFFWYLFEQKGSSLIQQINQSINKGYDNLNTLVDIQNTMLKFEQATLNEVLHIRGIANKTDIANNELRYSDNVFPLNLTSLQTENYNLTTDITLGNGSKTIYVSPNGAAFFTITQPANFSGNTSFRVAHSSNNSPIIVTIEKVK